MHNTIGRIDYESMEKKVKIDLKDRRILSLLDDDSRTPLTQIAKKVQLSRDAVDYRIKRLQKKGVILRFVPSLNYEKLGFQIFHVFLLVDEFDKAKQQDLIDYLKNHQNIFSIIEYSDRWDLEIVIIAKSLLEFDKIISDIAEHSPDIILEKEKLEIIRRYNSNYVPPLIKEEHDKEKIKHEKEFPAKLDETDFKLLKLLAGNCRQSTYAIGKELGLSGDAISYRIKKLQLEDVIKKFTILVNFSLLQYHWYTFSIEMKLFNLQNEKKFETFLDQNPNIMRSAKTLGSWDLLLYVIVENRQEFHRIVKDMKNVFANIIRNYQTWIAYKEHKFEIMSDAIK
ncbi:Lrp/AsnC family transcriptional regulator [archaeon]|nr:Lrp/AsnC family transcriptional regulator [archaeon]MBL7056909.1 Lrp/AsnC family transcriptional regulator [Candidatus Woesearchaeota archaeon]